MVLCSKFNFSVEKIDLIVDYTREKNKVMVGHNNYFEGKIATPLMIFYAKVMMIKLFILIYLTQVVGNNLE